MARSFENTKAAAAIYLAGVEDRDQMLLTVKSKEDVDAYFAVCEDAANELRMAFYKDTSDINRWDDVRTLHPSSLLRYAPTPWETIRYQDKNGNNARITYHPEWSVSQPWVGYVDAYAGRHFENEHQADTYFKARGFERSRS